MAGLMDHIAVRSRTTVYELIEAGMPVHQPLPNGRLWFDLHEVDAWLRNRWFSVPAAQSADEAAA